MSSLTNITVSTDHVAHTATLIDQQFRQVLTSIASALEQSVKAVAKNDNHSAQAFWDRIGTGGAALLTELATWRGILQAKAPDLVNDTIASAGSTLTVNPDGSITVPAE